MRSQAGFITESCEALSRVEGGNDCLSVETAFPSKGVREFILELNMSDHSPRAQMQVIPNTVSTWQQF